MPQPARARVFMRGHSQCITIPAAFRLTTNEVIVTQDPNTGALILSPAPRNWMKIFAALDEAGFKDLPIEEREQGEYPDKEYL